MNIPTPSWLDRAACSDDVADLFFQPQAAHGGDYAPARSVCRRCPVQSECLTHALDNDERYGMWGGATPAERERMRPARTTSADRLRQRLINQALVTVAEWDQAKADGRSSQAIAARHGISEKSYGKRVWRARAVLRNEGISA